MSDAAKCQSFFVKVEGQCLSNHRNPKGVYKVDVVEEKTIVHSACAALNVARNTVPFLNENPHGFTLRAFKPDGQEIVIPRTVPTKHDHMGFYSGRSYDHPDTITVQ